MKTRLKRKRLLLIMIGIICIYSILKSYNLMLITKVNQKNSDDIKIVERNLKNSKLSGRIHIANNWSDVKKRGIATGSGTYSDPYIIEDLVIDTKGLEYGINVENSRVYFKIENCTIYNTIGVDMYDWTYGGGIVLSNVSNARIINNHFSLNWNGIGVFSSYNNSISGNFADNNEVGISLYTSDSNNISGNVLTKNSIGLEIYNFPISSLNIISGNTVNNNDIGIFLEGTEKSIVSGNLLNENPIRLMWNNNFTLTGNLMNKCGVIIHPDGDLGQLASNNIETTNLVNDKPLYFYINEKNLGSHNFTNAGQVLLVNCSNSLISNLNVSYSSRGISLFFTHKTIISENIANYDSGIILFESEYNDIIRNTVSYNEHNGIELSNSHYNNISENIANNNDNGIALIESHNNNILRNKANYNEYNGIDLRNSNYNVIKENTILWNGNCIDESGSSKGNTFENNICMEKITIPGYNFILLLLLSISFIGIISTVIIFKGRKLKKS